MTQDQMIVSFLFFIALYLAAFWGWINRKKAV